MHDVPRADADARSLLGELHPPVAWHSRAVRPLGGRTALFLSARAREVGLCICLVPHWPHGTGSRSIEWASAHPHGDERPTKDRSQAQQCARNQPVRGQSPRPLRQQKYTGTLLVHFIKKTCKQPAEDPVPRFWVPRFQTHLPGLTLPDPRFPPCAPSATLPARVSSPKFMAPRLQATFLASRSQLYASNRSFQQSQRACPHAP